MNFIMSDRQIPSDIIRNSNCKYIELADKQIHNCVGCFSCWTKTPGKCVIRDDAVTIYPLIAKADNLIYVSKLFCGSYDIPVKTMLERAIPVQQAFIRLHNGETHHIQREVHEKNAVIIAYGDKNEIDIPAKEKELFKRLVARNAHNMCFKNYRITFASESNVDEILRKEASLWENC